MSPTIRANAPQYVAPETFEVPLKEIITHLWPKHMLLDIIFKSNDEMVKFKNTVNEREKKLSVRQLLPLARKEEPDSCLRITSTLETMNLAFAVLFEMYPPLSDFLLAVVQKDIPKVVQESGI